MENNNIEGKLKMTNLGFLSFDFKHDLEVKGPMKIQFSFKVVYKILSEKARRIKVFARAIGEDERLELNIIEQAEVELVNAELLDDNMKESILSENSVAIMFPYLRSQIALLTSQPGMMPIQTPIIDIRELVKNSSIEE